LWIEGLNQDDIGHSLDNDTLPISMGLKSENELIYMALTTATLL